MKKKRERDDRKSNAASNATFARLEAIAEGRAYKEVENHEGIYIHIKKKVFQGILAMIPACIPLLFMFFVIGAMASFDAIVYNVEGDKDSGMVNLMHDASPTNDQYMGATLINVPQAWVTFFITVMCVLCVGAVLASIALIFFVATHFFGENR